MDSINSTPSDKQPNPVHLSEAKAAIREVKEDLNKINVLIYKALEELDQSEDCQAWWLLKTAEHLVEDFDKVNCLQTFVEQQQT